MAQLATNTVPLAGLVVNTLLDAAATPANGDTAATGSGTFLVARNTDAATRTITLVTPGTVDGDLAVADRTSVTIPVTAGLAVIPLVDTYRDPATGLATLNFSATANLKVIVVRTVV